MHSFSIQHVELADAGEDALYEPPAPWPQPDHWEIPPAWRAAMVELAREREEREARAYQARYGRVAGWDVDYAYTNHLALEDLELVCRNCGLPLFLFEDRPLWWPERESGRVAFWGTAKGDGLAAIDQLTGYWWFRLLAVEEGRLLTANCYGADLNDLVVTRLGGKRAGAAWRIARWFGTEPWRFGRAGA